MSRGRTGVLASLALAGLLLPLPSAAGELALVGATVHPVSGPPVAGATILVRDGTIAAVGRDLRPSPGATVVDLSGLHVYPSLIAADTVLGLVEIGSVRGTIDVSEVGDIHPNVRAQVAVNPDSELLPVAISNGVLLAGVSPHGGLISGTSAFMALSGWTWEDMTLRAPVGLRVDWPSMMIRRGPKADPSPEEQERRRDDRIREIRDAFREARAWRKAREARDRPGVPRQDNDVAWEAMGPVLRGEIPVFVQANDRAEIEAALEWAREEKVRIVITGGRDAWQLADRLAREDVPVVLHPVLALPARDYEAYDTPFTAPARLHDAGVRFCISVGSGPWSAWNVRNLPYSAAMAVAFGLPRDSALRSITLDAARILGVDDRYGSIEPGKDATLIVTDGDPLEIPTLVRRAFLHGREIDLLDRHKRLYEKYRNRPRPVGSGPTRLEPAP